MAGNRVCDVLFHSDRVELESKKFETFKSSEFESKRFLKIGCDEVLLEN